MSDPPKESTDADRLLKMFEAIAAAAERGWVLLAPKPKPPTEPIERHV